jgi:hypothetical protein
VATQWRSDPEERQLQCRRPSRRSIKRGGVSGGLVSALFRWEEEEQWAVVGNVSIMPHPCNMPTKMSTFTTTTQHFLQITSGDNNKKSRWRFHQSDQGFLLVNSLQFAFII